MSYPSEEMKAVSKVHIIFLVTLHHQGVIRFGMKGQEGDEVGRGPVGI